MYTHLFFSMSTLASYTIDIVFFYQQKYIYIYIYILYRTLKIVQAVLLYIHPSICKVQNCGDLIHANQLELGNQRSG